MVQPRQAVRPDALARPGEGLDLTPTQECRLERAGRPGGPGTGDLAMWQLTWVSDGEQVVVMYDSRSQARGAGQWLRGEGLQPVLRRLCRYCGEGGLSEREDLHADCVAPCLHAEAVLGVA